MRDLTNKKQTWLCQDVHAELQEHRAWPAQCDGRRRACERRRARGTDLHGQPKKGHEQGEEHARKKVGKVGHVSAFILSLGSHEGRHNVLLEDD